MIKIDVKMEEGDVISLDVKNPPEINVDVTSPPVIRAELFGTGPRGKAGHGMTPGGTKGQILRRKTNTDHDNEWADFDYDDLLNQPSIEGVPLIGDTSFPLLNLNALSNTEIENLLTV